MITRRKRPPRAAVTSHGSRLAPAAAGRGRRPRGPGCRRGAKGTPTERSSDEQRQKSGGVRHGLAAWLRSLGQGRWRVYSVVGCCRREAVMKGLGSNWRASAGYL
jgi:hypothetical protein